ncbi:MAG: protein kinase [Polyangiaceae bacterium]
MASPQPFGRFELHERIGAGGMAEVYRAKDTSRNLWVALKRILPQIAEDEEFVRMFEDEALIASQLEHPYIARMLDYGRVGRAYYIAFEYVDGKDVRSIFDRCVRQKERLPLSIVLYIVSRVAEGLSYAHARRDSSGNPVSIVHRDVSPQNIIISYEGDVRLIDFGIAKAAGKISRTQVGSLKGKFGYMAPEQVRGGDIDQRVDVFSLGTCLWELLTLERLFYGENEIIALEKLRSREIPPPSSLRSDVPKALDEIVLRSLARDRNERYRAAKDFYRDLNHLAHDIGAVASRDEVAEFMRRNVPATAPLDKSTADKSSAGKSTRESMPTGDVRNEGKPALSPMMAASGSGDLPAPPPLGGSSKDAVSSKDASGDSSPRGDSNRKAGDLDIFEGLGKKNTSAAALASAPGARPIVAPPGGTPLPPPVMKQTLLGVPPAANSGPGTSGAPTPVANPIATRSAAPPPPPGRASLPPIVPPPGGPSASTLGARSPSLPPPPAGARSVPPPLPSRPKSSPSISEPSSPTSPGGVGDSSEPVSVSPNDLSMDWDDDEEATHVFDKSSEEAGRSERAMRPGHNTAPLVPGGKAMKSTLVGVAPASQPSMPLAPPNFPANGSNASPFARNAALPPLATPPGTHGPLPSVSLPPTPGMAHANSASHATDVTPPNRMEATALVRPPSGGRTGLYAGIGVALAIGIGALVVSMMPKGGRVMINATDGAGLAPAHVDVFVDGTKRCDTVPCLVEQVTPGEHTVKVAATGFDQTLPKSITVESRRDVSVEFALAAGATAKAGTGIRVASATPGARLLVDDKMIGTLPQELKDLAPGDHKVRIEAGDRYVALERTVSIPKDSIADLGSLPLKVARGKATFVLETAGAKVHLVSGTDRRELPTLPISVDIDTTRAWTVEATKAGFTEFKAPVTFDEGVAEKTFNVVLEAKGAATTPTAEPAPVKATPAPQPPARTPTPTPAPVAKPTPKPAEVAAGEGTLNINSIPASSVVLDGRPIGATPKLGVSVKAGSHTILFVNADEGLKKQITVTVAAGETKAASAKLRD